MELKKLFDDAKDSMSKAMDVASDAMDKAARALDGTLETNVKKVEAVFGEVSKKFKYSIDEVATKEGITIKAAFPGIPKERVKVTVAGPFLTVVVISLGAIAGSMEQPTDFRQSWNVGRYHTADLKVTYADGLLTIVIPAEAQPEYETKEIKF